MCSKYRTMINGYMSFDVDITMLVPKVLVMHGNMQQLMYFQRSENVLSL